MLTENQIEQYNNDGFIVIDGVFSDLEIEELTQAMNHFSVQNHLKKDHEGFGYFLVELTKIHPTFLKYASHPKIIKRIKKLIGNDIHLHHSKLTTKMPGSKKAIIPFHQDFLYLPHTNTSLLAVMISLVDFTSDNGCMQAVKGSHKFGMLDEAEIFKIEKNIMGGFKVESLQPKKGGISIHHCLTLHGSGDNITNVPRYSLVYQYRARDAYQLSAHIFEETGLVVSGKTHNEPLHIRLEQCEILLINKYHSPFKEERRCGNFSDDFPFGNAFNQYGKLVC